MNLFGNIGVTEILIILLLALLVVGPERLPEMSRQLAKTLRELRKAYANLTRDLGPELTSIQKTTTDLRDTVASVRSIPQELVRTVVESAQLDETVEQLKQTASEARQAGQTLSELQHTIQDPVGSAVEAARESLSVTQPAAAAPHPPAPAPKRSWLGRRRSPR